MVTAPPTFLQESRLGRVIYQLREGALFISIPRFAGGFDEYRVDLRRIDPNYRPRALRLNFQLALLGGFFVLCCLAVWGAHQTPIPAGALHYLLHWPYVGIGASLILAFQFSFRVEGFLFSDNWGKPLFMIARERAQATDCEAFIHTLVAHIEVAHSNLTAVEREAVLRQVARESTPLPQADRDVAFWKISLVLGVLAVGIPWVPGLAYYFDLFQFMIVFWLCVGGAACSVFSYIQKERYRHWSAVGLVLSLIPPFFY